MSKTPDDPPKPEPLPRPTCPRCKVVMTPINYCGYYDAFSYWQCSCNDFTDGKKESGMYA